MVHIKCIEYMDKEYKEAIVEISNEEISIIAFSCPYNPDSKKGSVTLYGFMTENIVLEDAFQLPVKTDSGFFSYHITAEVVDTAACLVRIGTIYIILSTSLPRDIPNGAYISFDVQRLDY